MKLVIVHEGQAVVSTVDIAKHFKKNHFDILKAVRNLECSEEFIKDNFIESTYSNGGRNYPCYLLTIKGFIFLTSAFTGSNLSLIREELCNTLDKVQDAHKLFEALKNFEIPEDLPDMYIYVIQEEVSKAFKIGISKNPQARLKQLQTGNSSKLSLIYTTKAESRFQDELELHKLFEEYKLQGEWFHLNNIT
jgi:Rha family phage regulatory protein